MPVQTIDELRDFHQFLSAKLHEESTRCYNNPCAKCIFLWQSCLGGQRWPLFLCKNRLLPFPRKHWIRGFIASPTSGTQPWRTILPAAFAITTPLTRK